MIGIHYGAEESLLIFAGNEWGKAFRADPCLYNNNGCIKQMPDHMPDAQQAERSSAP